LPICTVKYLPANDCCIAIRIVLRKRLCPREDLARGSLHACDMCLKERSKLHPEPLGSVETSMIQPHENVSEKEKTVTTRAHTQILAGTVREQKERCASVALRAVSDLRAAERETGRLPGPDPGSDAFVAGCPLSVARQNLHRWSESKRKDPERRYEGLVSPRQQQVESSLHIS
jgi:hypothetical protein